MQSSTYIEQENEGAAFVQRLVDELGVADQEPIDGLTRLYKEAGRIFKIHLYTNSADLFPADALSEMAWPVYQRWQTATQGGEFLHEVSTSPKGKVLAILADAIALRSCPERVSAEMMFALATEAAARQYADAWWNRHRGRHSPAAEGERWGRRHAVWTAKVVEVLGILWPEFERWWEGAAASLRGIVAEVEAILDEEIVV